jgi:hypothetical protein
MATFNAGSEVSAADLNSTVPSLCFCVQQAAQSGWSTGTPTAITFGTGSTVTDTDTIHSESTNTSRFVIGKRLGWWQVCGVYVPAGSASSTSLIRCIVYKNNNYVPGSFVGLSTSFTTALNGIATPVVEIEATASTDYIELFGYQTSSGTVGTSVNTYAVSSLSLKWIRTS